MNNPPAMDPLKQYLDLYRSQVSTVEEHSVPAMNMLRARAYESLERHGLPLRGTENYETTDIGAILSPDYGINLSKVDMHANISSAFRCGVPHLSSQPLFTVNDTPRIPEGITFGDGIWAGSLVDFCRKFPETATKHYGRIADIDNPLVALDTLLAQDGIAIHATAKANNAKPIQLVNILSSAFPLLAVRRVLIIAEPDSEIKVLACDHTQTGTPELASLQVVEIYAGNNSTVDYYDLEESGDNTRRLSALYLSQQEGSNVTINGITLNNGITRNEYHTVFEGVGATLSLYGMGIEDGGGHLDNYSCIRHAAKNCRTDELFKYVVDGHASGAFGGLIHVCPGADKTEAYQSNRNIVGTTEARMFSKPQLEIYNDDVKCSHGSATGQLDEMQVFYMRTRGIPEATAKLLLKQAFMADVIDGIRLEPLKERLHMLVEQRLSGSVPTCTSCHACPQL